MTRTSRRAAVAALSAGTLLALAAPAVHAESLTIKDGADDVWVAGSQGQPDMAATKAIGEADVRRVVVRHGARVVVVRATFVDLTRRGAGLNLVADFRTDEGTRRGVGLFTDNYAVEPFPKETVQTWKGTGEAVRCAVLHKVDYRLNVMSMTVPRRCLGGPGWVQVRVQNAWLTHGYDHAYVDNPHNDQSRFKAWSGRVRRG